MISKKYLVLRAFTLIELMIVIAIIATLAAVAIPSYQSYIEKAKFSEIILATAPYKVAIEVCAQRLSGFSSSDQNINCGTNNTNGIPSAFKAISPNIGYVSSIITAYEAPNVLIEVISQRLKETYTYILKGNYQDNGQILWQTDKRSSCLRPGLCE